MTPHSDDDLAMRLTSAGPAALAVVRLLGPGVGPFLRRRFSRPVVVGRAVHGLLRDAQGQTIDDPVAVLCDSHKADLTLHGGPWVIRSALSLAERDGFRVLPADGQPLATGARSCLEEEVFLRLPGAPTPAAVRMLLAQPDAWTGLARRGDVAECRAVLADPSGRWLLSTPTVAIVGPPNVGKSTLANRLFGQARSITADAPGTTRDWVGGVADVGGLAVTLVDTPGVRRTSDPIEAAAIAAGQARAESADLTVLVLDRSRPLDADARAMLARHPAAVRVANKADATPAWSDAAAIPTAATSGLGMEQVGAAVRQRFGCEPIVPDRPRWWTDPQRADLERVISALSSALSSASESRP